MTSTQNPPEAMTRWDAMMPSYLRWGEPVSSVFAKAAFERVAPVAGMRVLDIGAGTGNLAVPAAAHGCFVLAIDNSDHMIRLLEDRLDPYRDSHAELMDARDLQVGVANFDAVFSVFSVTFISDYAEIFLRMVQALKPGGTLALVHWATACGAPYFEILLKALGQLGINGQPPVDTFLAPSELEDALRVAGCTDIETVPLVAECEFPPPESILDELDFFFRAIAAYRDLDPATKKQLAPIMAKEVAAVPVVEGRRVLPCTANLFVGKRP